VRRDRSEDFTLAAEREAYYPERNLRLIAVRKHLERWNKIRIRDQVRTELTTVVGFRPTVLRFAIHRQHQDRMMGRKIRRRVVAAIAVSAYGHHHVRFRVQQTPQFVKRDATDVRGRREIRVAGRREADLG
jgi:hypothetical protein